MREVRALISKIDDISENQMEELIQDSDSPDVAFALLLCIFDRYSNGPGTMANIPQCHWLYDSAQICIDKVFSLVASASGENKDDIKFMLYRSALYFVARNKDEIYRDFEEQFPLEFRHVCENEKWPWPVIEDISGHRNPDIIFRDFSALKLFGYTVGKTAGWPPSKRRQFLTDFMEKDLPIDVTKWFGDEYGQPMSTDRLRKVANVIANNCSLRIRNNRNLYKHAISDWLADLHFLKTKYYDGFGLKFVPWPDPR